MFLVLMYGKARSKTRTSLEPQQGNDTTKTNFILEDIRNTHTGVQKLLSTLIGNRGDEGGRLADKTKFLIKKKKKDNQYPA